MGLPIAFALTGGEVSDFKGYLPIMNADGPAPKVLLADKGYDADYIREDMERRGAAAMIPTKRNRKIQLLVDPAIYALRNMVARCFNKLKNARGFWRCPASTPLIDIHFSAKKLVRRHIRRTMLECV